LADAVRTAAEHHDLPAIGRFGLALFFIGGVEVGGIGREFGRTGVDTLIDRTHAHVQTGSPDLGLRCPRELSKPCVGEALALEEEHVGFRERVKGNAAELVFRFDDLTNLMQEPRINGRKLVQFFVRHAGTDAVGEIKDALRTGHGDFMPECLAFGPGLVETVVTSFKPAQGLLQRFLEGASDGHHFAYRLHLRRETVVGGGELFKRKARHLRDNVVDRRLKGGRSESARDFVAKLIQRVPHGELGGNAGNRESRGL